MHPRTAVRKEIAALLASALPDVRVLAASVRDISDLQGSQDLIAVEVPQEEMQRQEPKDGSEASVYFRVMRAEVTCYAMRSGHGEQALDAAESLMRRVEIVLNGYSSAIEIVTGTSEIASSQQPIGVCTTAILVAPEMLDDMKPAAQEI